MILLILGFVLSQASPDQMAIDNIIKARIARLQCPPDLNKRFKQEDDCKPKPQTKEPPLSDYAIKRQLAINQNRPMIVLVGGAEIKHCTNRGCYPLPSAWVIYKCKEFTVQGENVTNGIIVSSAHDGELWYLRTVPDSTTMWDIDNIINAAVVVTLP